MVVDTSAIVAIVQGEPERLSFVRSLNNASAVLISAVSWMECRMVLLGRLGQGGVEKAQKLARESELEVVPASRQISDMAFAAFRNFGKGRHPAGLNFGDCFSYALAIDFGAPLLYKGRDFARTDVVSAMA